MLVCVSLWIVIIMSTGLLLPGSYEESSIEVCSVSKLGLASVMRGLLYKWTRVLHARLHNINT